MLNTGEDQETKKQKQKALIEAAFKNSAQKIKNEEAEFENGDVNGQKSDDGMYTVLVRYPILMATPSNQSKQTIWLLLECPKFLISEKVSFVHMGHP